MLTYSLIIYFGLLLCLAACSLGLLAGWRVCAVARHGTLPVISGCCLPSLPAIQGLLWMGTFLLSGATAANLVLSAGISSGQLCSLPYEYRQTGASAPPTGTRADCYGGGFLSVSATTRPRYAVIFQPDNIGGLLMVFSAACIFTSAVFFSVVGCCVLGPLPGVGTSASNRCCVERNSSQMPPETDQLRLATPPSSEHYSV